MRDHVGGQKMISNVEASNLKQIWKQEKIPVVLRRTALGEQLRVRLPMMRDNAEWLRNSRRRLPKFFPDADKNYWELPKSWFNDFVDRALKRFGQVYIIQPYREQEKCAPACQNAAGHECECSCMGLHHGASNDGTWFIVSDVFATRWQARELACRLLTARDGSRL